MLPLLYCNINADKVQNILIHIWAYHNYRDSYITTSDLLSWYIAQSLSAIYHYIFFFMSVMKFLY